MRAIGALFFFSIFVRCQAPGDGPFLRVLLENVPSEAERVIAYTFLSGATSNDVLDIELNGQSSFTFGIRLASPAAGRLVTSVGIVNAAGCLLATATGTVDLSSGDDSLAVSLRLKGLDSAPLCTAGRMTLLAAEPTEISTAQRERQGQRTPLRLRGWGFRSGATVTLGGIAQTGVEVVSAEEIVIPAPQTVLAPGPARISVSLPDQPEVSRADLLSIFVEPIALRVIPAGAPVPSDALLDVATGDFNRDGTEDLAIFDVRGVLSVFHNVNKKLVLAQKLVLSLSGLSASSTAGMVSADVSGDGTVDLVIASTSGTAIVQRQSDGTYAATRQLPELLARDVAVADMDGDKQPDLVLAGDELGAYLNAGGGDFPKTPAMRLPIPSESVTLADFNNDGRQDVLLAALSGDVVILRNEPGGLRSVFQLPLRAGCLSFQGRVLATDLDGDGVLDIVANGTSALLLGRGDGFAAHYIEGVAPCFGGAGIAATDLNHDGLKDVLWLLSSSTVVLPSTVGKIGTQAPGGVSIPANVAAFAVNGPRHIPLLDLDGDGVKEVAIGVNVLGSAATP